MDYTTWPETFKNGWTTGMIASIIVNNQNMQTPEDPLEGNSKLFVAVHGGI